MFGKLNVYSIFFIHFLCVSLFSGILTSNNGRRRNNRQRLFRLKTIWHVKFAYCSFHIRSSKTFWAITFLLFFVLFSWYFFSMCVNVFFYITRNKTSVKSDKNEKNPHRPPIIKIAHLCNVMSIDMALQKWAIFIMEIYGENICLL